MALTKLPKNAITDGSIDSDKIEDGTIQAVELSGTLPEEKLATGTIENAKLSNSSITINGTSVSLGGSSSFGIDVNWQSVQTSSFTAVAGDGYFVDTTSGAITVTLPASATLGDQIAIKDYAGTFATNNLTIGRNGHNIQGVANDSLISTNRASLRLVYVDSTKGWIYAEESNVANLEKLVAATGGTVTESGDYKIHTFTGDGCFVVTESGSVDYLVIAGGGGGGATQFTGNNRAGGAGAGGYRESSGAASGCYTVSPLGACVSALPVSVTTYPVTVGAGGPGAYGAGATNGSPSIFSTITSAGGGKGAECSPAPTQVAGAGGSGGGSAARGTFAVGNTPPVSPPQGNNGGASTGFGGTGGGGGGAGEAGNTDGQGAGGDGATSSINGTPTTRAGGGGASLCVAGGTGGGGNANGGNGTVNTGGGGAGNYGACAAGGSGGSGIVIIRYKFQ